MEKQKLAAVRNFLKSSTKKSGQKSRFQEVVQSLVQCEAMLQACYDEYLDFDIQTLARIVAIDAIYLLQFLEWYNEGAGNPEIRELENDLFMLENQIPVILLQKVAHVLDYSHSSLDKFQRILCAHSPLKLSLQRKIIKDENQLHLLHRLYHLIVNNTGPDIPFYCKLSNGEISWNEVNSVVSFLGNQGLPGAVVAGKIISFVKDIPWNKILALLKNDEDKNQDIVKEIDIPSVFEMTEKAGIKFKHTVNGIRAIKCRAVKQGNIFYLPVINVKLNMEIILRNLVAFEAVLGKPGSEFAQYVDLMCGIIHTKKDVDILRKASILKSELDDEEIVGIFNAIKNPIMVNWKLESKIKQAIDAAKKQYDKVVSVKAKRFVRSYGPWLLKYVKLMVYVLIVVMLTLQAYCSAFGCSSWFGKITTLRGGYDILCSDQLATVLFD